jgi:hypothetical protein
VIGEVSFEHLSERLHHAEETLGREVNLSVYPEAEFREKAAYQHYFIASVIENPKLFVIGDADALRRLAQTELAEQTEAHSTGNQRPVSGRRSRPEPVSDRRARR